MTTTQIPDAVRRIFTESFTARDVAEPLASFDASTAAAEVRSYMDASDFDVVGVRRAGRVVGFVNRTSLEGGACGDFAQEFEETMLAEDTTPLVRVLTALSNAQPLFVRTFGGVCGIVTAADIQKPPVRMWLFGMVTLIEMRCAQLIEQNCPEEMWRRHLSEGRLKKAEELLAERSRRNQSLRLFDCLQFSDKGQIIARDEELRKKTMFASRRQAEDATAKLQQLRNNLAHAQEIPAADWDTIVDLCAFLNC